ncbi:MAG TPA: hypothetical protein VLG28_17590, partial [Acidimicrobiia bacterium]|nr:hypothetical protein [Acidimicrobiia bacterium]
NTISLETTASGHIEIGDFATDNLLRPFGLRNDPGRPYQCYLLSVPVAANQPQVCQAVEGDDVDLLEVFNIAPPNNPSCPTPNSPSNLRDGIDHLVETDADTTQTRSAFDACRYGHHLTMPNAAELTTPSTGQLTSGLTQGGGPLQGASLPLWEYLVAGLPGACNKADILALPTLEEQSNSMRRCIESGTADFIDGVVDSPRFSWAIRTTAGTGSLKNYDDLTLIFLNTIVSDDVSLTPEQAQTLNGPPAGSGNVGAVTMYELRLGDLSSSDQARLIEPAGSDWLEFSLTN